MKEDRFMVTDRLEADDNFKDYESVQVLNDLFSSNIEKEDTFGDINNLNTTLS